MGMTPRQVRRYLHHSVGVRAVELLELFRVQWLPNMATQARVDQLAIWQNRADPDARNTGGRNRVRTEHLDQFLRNTLGFRHGG